MAIGGGEVAVDVTVDTGGAVTAVAPLRATPPFTDLVVNTVRGWRFQPATAVVEKQAKPAEGHVLVVGVFRPPQVYSTPARGEPVKVVGKPSPEVPQPGTHPVPLSYPPRAVRDGTVLIEIELTAAGVARGHRVMSPASPFDSAALEAVKTWRFGFPAKPTGATQLWVYAIVGFREPITQ
jgi:TonB family protein